MCVTFVVRRGICVKRNYIHKEKWKIKCYFPFKLSYVINQTRKMVLVCFAYDKRSYEDLFIFSTVQVTGPCRDIFYDEYWSYIPKELVTLPAAKKWQVLGLRLKRTNDASSSQKMMGTGATSRKNWWRFQRPKESTVVLNEALVLPTPPPIGKDALKFGQ